MACNLQWSLLLLLLAPADCFVSLAYNSAGKPCIAYGSGTLMYAEYDGTTWTKTQLEPRKVNAWGKSLAFDANGNPGIAYYLGGPKGFSQSLWSCYRQSG